MLFAGLYLVALGVGGIKGTLPSHGAEQFDEATSQGRKQRSAFFNYYVFCLSAGLLLQSLLWSGLKTTKAGNFHQKKKKKQRLAMGLWHFHLNNTHLHPTFSPRLFHLPDQNSSWKPHHDHFQGKIY